MPSPSCTRLMPLLKWAEVKSGRSRTHPSNDFSGVGEQLGPVLQLAEREQGVHIVGVQPGGGLVFPHRVVSELPAVVDLPEGPVRKPEIGVLVDRLVGQVHGFLDVRGVRWGLRGGRKGRRTRARWRFPVKGGCLLEVLAGFGVPARVEGRRALLQQVLDLLLALFLRRRWRSPRRSSPAAAGSRSSGAGSASPPARSGRREAAAAGRGARKAPAAGPHRRTPSSSQGRRPGACLTRGSSMSRPLRIFSASSYSPLPS